MSIEAVTEYLKQYGLQQQIKQFSTSSATVALAAEALGVAPARIAKTLSFAKEEGCLLVVCAGDSKIDNAKFKRTFGQKARMLTPQEVTEKTGHMIGGVCPFALPAGAQVYLDLSLKRFETVFPACGSSNSAIELSCEQLESLSHAIDWVDVCKLIEE